MIKTDLHISEFMLHEDRIRGDKSGNRDPPGHATVDQALDDGGFGGADGSGGEGKRMEGRHLEEN